MDFIEATPLPTECRCCQKTDCYNCDHASKRWTLSKKQELLLLRKLKEKAILRFKRQIEEIDYPLRPVRRRMGVITKKEGHQYA